MAGKYDGWGNEKGRFTKLARGDWQDIPFDRRRRGLKKRGIYSDVTLPPSEVGEFYTSPWTFLWIEDDLDHRWFQDARIVWKTLGDESDKARIRQFFQNTVF